MSDISHYALVQGRFYQGDIEGKQYHWTKGIPGSKQLSGDLQGGKVVNFIYYRTWDKDTKRGKYFYGKGVFDNESFKTFSGESGKTEYYANIKSYDNFQIPVIVEDKLRKKVWPGVNRQAGIKRISETIFEEIVRSDVEPDSLIGLGCVIGERALERLFDGNNIDDIVKDSEGVKAVKHAVNTEVYKRTHKTIKRLKKYYKGICQITGQKLDPMEQFGVDVTEAHHIEFLSGGGIDDISGNLIIISPEWHSMLHKKPHEFDKDQMVFVFSDSKILPVKHPGHLEQK